MTVIEYFGNVNEFEKNLKSVCNNASRNNETNEG